MLRMGALQVPRLIPMLEVLEELGVFGLFPDNATLLSATQLVSASGFDCQLIRTKRLESWTNNLPHF